MCFSQPSEEDNPPKAINLDFQQSRSVKTLPTILYTQIPFKGIMVTKNIKLGGLELKLLFAIEKNSLTFVSSKEIRTLSGVSQHQANKLAYRLVRKKRLIRMRKGEYLYAPLKAGLKGEWSENALKALPKIFAKKDEYYVSFWSGLRFYDLTEQLPIVMQVVVRKSKRGFSALGTRFVFIRLRRFGEWKDVDVGGARVHVATPEQLVVDCLTNPQYCGGIVEASKSVWNFRKKMYWKRLALLARNNGDAACSRLGFLLEEFGLPVPKVLVKKYDGWRLLESRRGVVDGKAERSSKWGIIINVPRNDITNWRYS